MDRRYICWLTREGVIALNKEKEHIRSERLPWARQLIATEPKREQYQNIMKDFLKRILKINQMLHYNQNLSANYAAEAVRESEKEALKLAKTDFYKGLKEGLSNLQVDMIMSMAEKYMLECEQLREQMTERDRTIDRLSEDLKKANCMLRFYGIIAGAGE
ncbi:hypothetical protein [Paenibacillus polymyxa]|uniref:hypothetical protein n=1 Tax=Paenibacillus polymyxa TaxID=1406 RepID=UPI0025B6EFC0|nr:hypothetical protein [Paenibacillus polymyxa]MDN4090884.1 hypothetical protein [Paenibacillus polymyxa]